MVDKSRGTEHGFLYIHRNTIINDHDNVDRTLVEHGVGYQQQHCGLHQNTTDPSVGLVPHSEGRPYLDCSFRTLLFSPLFYSSARVSTLRLKSEINIHSKLPENKSNFEPSGVIPSTSGPLRFSVPPLPFILPETVIRPMHHQLHTHHL